jgi:hypothetical protein
VRKLALALGGVALVAAALVLASAALDQPSRYYRDAVVVEASRERIWSLLTNLDGYRDWNPYITDAGGDAREGATIEFHTEPQGEDAEDLTAEVLIVHPRRKFEWQTRRFVPGVLDHEQIFRVIPVGQNRWRIVQEARFEGVLTPFVDLDGERRGLAQMLHALADRAAADYQSSSG